MSYNVPEDWHNYWSKCSECGVKTHASDGHYCEPEKEEEPTWAVTDITFRVYHDEIDDVDLLEQAQLVSTKMHKLLEDMFGVPVEMHEDDVVVCTE